MFSWTRIAICLVKIFLEDDYKFINKDLGHCGVGFEISDFGIEERRSAQGVLSEAVCLRFRLPQSFDGQTA